jgi:predicted alpha/beta-hydrolase family hydrolase
MPTEFLFDGPDTARFTILLAHGAGGPMDSTGMTTAAANLATAGFRVARFEFAYMASRRSCGGRKPPPRAETLKGEYFSAIEELNASKLIVGGRSMGGRVASMIADELLDGRKAVGLLCLGYPFHAPDRPERPRTAHLADLRMPALICQGTRDIFGTPEDVESYELSDKIDIVWLEDGDHGLKPRKTISGFSEADHMITMADSVVEWSKRLA